MVEAMRTVCLKSGENLRVHKIVAPDAEWGARIVDFMYLRTADYTNSNWHLNCERLLRGDYADVSYDAFFVGTIDGAIVATSWYGAPLDTMDIATYGRILTDPAHRRKGIASVMCALPIEDFSAASGAVMYLGTSMTNSARYIYEALGFEHYNYVKNGPTVMRLILKGTWSEFEDTYYAPGQATAVRRISLGDLPRAEMLYNFPHWIVKDSSLGIIGNTPFEGQFFDLLSHVENESEVGLALTNTSGTRLLGLAYTATAPGNPSRQRHVRYMEFLVHPNYAEEASALLREVERRSAAATFVSQVAAGDACKEAALISAGYKEVGRVTGAVHTDCGITDLLIYQK